MESGLRKSTTTRAPLSTNAEHILVELKVLEVPASLPAAAEPPLSKTDADWDNTKEEYEDPPLLLGVKLTGYRLLNIVVIFTIGVAKGILSLKGQPIAPTGLELARGSVVATL